MSIRGGGRLVIGVGSGVASGVRLCALISLARLGAAAGLVEAKAKTDAKTNSKTDQADQGENGPKPPAGLALALVVLGSPCGSLLIVGCGRDGTGWRVRTNVLRVVWGSVAVLERRLDGRSVSSCGGTTGQLNKC